MAKRGNGEGTIVKRKDGRWMGVITTGRELDGSPKRKSIYGKTRKEVSEKMTVILLELQESKYIEPSKIAVGDWVLEWLDTYKALTIKKSTYYSYRTNIEYHIIPVIGHLTLSELRTDHVQSFVNQLHKNNKSSATIRKVVNILRGALEQAVINKIISENVVRGVRLPKHEAKEVSWFSEEEELRFKKAAEGDRLENFFKLDFLSGLRSGELLGLKWDAVDLKNGIIHVKRILMRHKDYITRKNKYEIVNTTKTIGSRRSIPIPPSAVKLLKQHKKQQEKEKRLAGDLYQDSNLVFCTALGNRLVPRNVDRSFKRIANKAGIPNVQVHSIRHTYATRLFERGVPAKIVSQLLGHKDVSHTLNIYTHVTHRLTSDAVMVLEYFSDNNFDNNATENRGYYGAIGENTAPPQPPQELH